MAFGIFKKPRNADIIYRNGHIYTQDPEFPWAESVACRDGRVLAVGDFDGMNEITGSDTEIIDLEGKYMFPGFIDVHDTPSLQVLKGLYLEIDPIWDLDTVLEYTAEYAQSCEKDIIFGYGYNENLLTDYDTPAEVMKILDEIETDRPVLLLSTGGYHCWMNTLASTIVVETVDEEEDLQFISAVDLLMNILSPFDYEEIEERIRQYTKVLADKGITSVLDLCSPEYFSLLYQDSLLAMIGDSEPIRQRYFGSLYLNRSLPLRLILHRLSTGRTKCTEMDGLMTFDVLKLETCDDENLSYFSQETLDELCLAACEKGFDIHLDALDAASVDRAFHTFERVRNKGYKGNALVLAAEGVSTPDDASFIVTWPTDYLNKSVFGHVNSVEEAIDQLTAGAAAILGKERDFGSIEQGKIADFTVFEENPFDAGLQKFSGMHASMTIMDSMITYDAEAELEEEMYDLLTTMRL
ncbi:amidohydrolase family protein [Ihubacter sp. rT4E-8]|uniref:amidohydrolase family protein n=1 Tax=unclassified Ihubacter TaxID=2633299 RepID=UPI003C7C79E5